MNKMKRQVTLGGRVHLAVSSTERKPGLVWQVQTGARGAQHEPGLRAHQRWRAACWPRPPFSAWPLCLSAPRLGTPAGLW